MSCPNDGTLCFDASQIGGAGVNPVQAQRAGSGTGGFDAGSLAGTAAAAFATGGTSLWIQAGSQVLGAALKRAPAGPSSADASNSFDNSGWTVATGSARASGAPARMTTTQMLALAGMALVGWVVWAKKH